LILTEVWILKKVAIIGGTHGNEVTGVELIKKWKSNPPKKWDLELFFEFGNPDAIKKGTRYIDQDLNRSFLKLSKKEVLNLEEKRAQELRERLKGMDFIIDLHTTTSNMGPTIILTHDEDQSLKAALHTHAKYPKIKLIREILPKENNHFLTSIAKDGLIIEVGPTPQGVVRADILCQMEQTLINLCDYLSNSTSIEKISKVPFYEVVRPIDYPREGQGQLIGIIHEDLQDKDFKPLSNGSPLFKLYSGQTIPYEGEELFPIFINEAAYYEKGVALVLTKKVLLNF